MLHRRQRREDKGWQQRDVVVAKGSENVNIGEAEIYRDNSHMFSSFVAIEKNWRGMAVTRLLLRSLCALGRHTLQRRER